MPEYNIPVRIIGGIGIRAAPQDFIGGIILQWTLRREVVQSPMKQQKPLTIDLDLLVERHCQQIAPNYLFLLRIQLKEVK